MRRLLLPLCLAVALSACGTQQPDRTTGGAATGATTGAVIGLIGGPIGAVVGAVIGGGAGAAGGAAIGPDHINLGAPPWSGNSPTAATPSAPTASNVSSPAT
jgi:phage tail tape-measure protein